MIRKDIKAVSIGGGCGAVQVLLGLSNYLDALTGIVAVTDTGRSTGKVRALANIPAPGDIRNAIATLATNEAFMAQLMQHRLRVPNNTTLDGVAFGNLMLAAITQMTGHFGQAVELMQNMAGVKANILPVTVSSTHICAELVDGQIIEQEFNVRALGKPDIRRVYIQDPAARAYEPCIAAIRDADLITIGPGSLFTTVIACLAFEDIAAAIRGSKATVAYICNNTTQPGQTDGFTLYDHVLQITRYLGEGVLDYALLNTRAPSSHAVRLYAADGVHVLLPTDAECARIQALGVTPVVKDLAEISDMKRDLWQKQDSIRHDPDAVAVSLMDLLSARG
jgi:uncharacterized cofD-like protein